MPQGYVVGVCFNTVSPQFETLEDITIAANLIEGKRLFTFGEGQNPANLLWFWGYPPIRDHPHGEWTDPTGQFHFVVCTTKLTERGGPLHRSFHTEYTAPPEEITTPGFQDAFALWQAWWLGIQAQLRAEANALQALAELAHRAMNDTDEYYAAKAAEPSIEHPITA